LATTICGSGAFTLIFFGERILLIWTGNAELSTQIFPLLQIMAIGTFFNCLMHVPHNLQLAYGWSSLAAKVNLFAVLFLVPAIVWFAPIYGSMGAAIIWAIFNIGNLVILSTLMFRKILVSEKYSWLFKDILIPGIAGITTVLLFFYLKPVFDSKVVESAYITFSAGITALTSTLFSNELRNYAQNNWLKK
jgi:O-antigen/teichoic acid export membrane protein